jgi:hypothetical protein
VVDDPTVLEVDELLHVTVARGEFAVRTEG